MPDSLNLSEARRIALAAQGFDASRPLQVTNRHLAYTIGRLGLHQIDSVNVLGVRSAKCIFKRAA